MEFKKILSYFGFPYIIEKTTSKYNGKIEVSSVFGRTSIVVANLSQSGPIVEGLWKTALNEVNSPSFAKASAGKQKSNVKSILVLGVGGGSVVKVLRRQFPKSKITGIEIDKKMVELGRNYFYLDYYRCNINIIDAFTFINKTRQKFDLIIVDLFLGQETPKKFYSEKFLKNLKRVLKSEGLIIINRLRIKKEKEDKEFYKNLQKYFINIQIKKPLINTLIYCRN